MLGFIPLGVPSINTRMTSIKIGIVVNKTITENKNVQIGSTMYASSHINMTIAAMTTPIDCIKSPITWMNAARTFKFSWEWP